MRLFRITPKKIHAVLCDKMGRKVRILYRNSKERKKLKKQDITILSQNCIGSIMYHDLGLQFNSPTINLLFSPIDFINFMKNIKWYLEQPLHFIKSDKPYPVGKLGGVLIKFIHYKSEKEALEAWNRRIGRINWDNIFVLCCDEGLTFDDMVEYDNLPYRNKILFMHYKDSSIRCGVFTKDFRLKTDAHLLEFCNVLGKRYYQKYFDYVKWLNEGNYWGNNID